MGGRMDGLGSSNTIVANNIFQGGGSMATISSSTPYTGTWSGNLRWQTSSAGNMPASGYTNVNPLLAADASGILHLQPGSPAIGAAKGTYPFVLTDMDGQSRDGNPDIGADEFSSAPITARILSTNDVGPNSAASFSVVPNPESRTVWRGTVTNVTYDISLTNVVGLIGPVSLSVSGLPANTAAAFNPPSITGSGSSILTVTVSNSAPAGYHVLFVTGTSTDSTNFTTVALLINRPPAITNIYLLAGGIVIVGEGTAGYLYRVLTASNLVDSISTWTALATNAFDPEGAFAFTNTPTAPQSFYAIQAL
jgi:hypothetical protein